MAVRFSNESATLPTPHFVSAANLERVYSVQSCSSLMKMLNSNGPVTGFQLHFVLTTVLWAWQFSQFLIHFIVHLSSLHINTSSIFYNL